MKNTNYLLVLIILFCFANCKNSIPENKMSQKDFFIFIRKEKNSTKSIKRIDSILINNTNSTFKKGLLYYEKGNLFMRQKKYIEAIVNSNKALIHFEEKSNNEFIGKVLLLKGHAESFLLNSDAALKHALKALNIFKELKHKGGEAGALDLLASIEFKYKNYDKAIAYHKQASKIFIQLDYKISLVSNYNNIAEVLELSGDTDKAIEYFQKSIASNNKINNAYSFPFKNLGKLFLKQNQFNKCNPLFLKALKIEEENEILSTQKEIYGYLFKSSIKNNKIENSIKYTLKKDSISELLIKEEEDKKIKSLEDKYNLIAKEKELIQEMENSDKNKIIFGILAGSLLLFVLFLIQKNKNSKLELKQEKLVLEQKVLRTQMNPHFIFNALTSIQKTIFDNDPIKSTSYLSKFAKLIRQNFEFVDKQEISLSEDLDALKNYIETQQLRFDDKFDYVINIDEAIDPSYIKIPPMLLQPFVENAIEHGLKPKTEKGNLDININKKKHLLCFEIIDNGVGLSKDSKNTDRDHAIDIFKKRLILRKLGEEKLFSMVSNKNKSGTIVTFYLNSK